jgi:hypothetical protein
MKREESEIERARAGSSFLLSFWRAGLGAGKQGLDQNFAMSVYVYVCACARLD